MRVLLVTDWNRGRGGAEAYVLWLRDGLRAAGDEVRLLTSGAGTAGDGTAEYVAPASERTAAQAFLQIANPLAVACVRRAVRELRPDVAFVNMFAHHLSPAAVHALGDVPAVVMVSDYKCVCPMGLKLLPDDAICTVRAGWVCHRAGCVGLAHWLRDRPRYALIRSAIGRARRVLACSAALARTLAADGIAAEVVLLPVPAPSPSFRRAPAPHPSFLFCGRLAREKGVALLLRAFARVRAAVPAATLRIAGDGAERPALERLAAELGLAGAAVSFLGWLDPRRVEAELASAWASVVPSLFAEPLGLVALEATVRRVPLVASRSGGLGEIVADGVTGLTFANGDDDALVERLLAIARGEAFAEHLVDEAAVRRVRAEHAIERHVAGLRDVLAAAAGRG